MQSKGQVFINIWPDGEIKRNLCQTEYIRVFHFILILKSTDWPFLWSAC